ncbi:DNA gyrase inhibitor YacG [Methylocella silvestris]|uniref:DNA gyrase inhibitor YacG n=1 Tax=Methylocella silvestris TaxID=199596 RepID=A0A2J7TEM9_METSI|nr:DNA gyrase inhibitor YacG [Methylocella silvestris]PNG25225.1 DNA gyrase inhibitor YacG [Methylocella silvestris]
MAEPEANPEAAADAAVLPKRACPICGKPAVAAMRPFCSKRCADVDLHRWLGGVYAIPASETEESAKGAAAEDE